MSSKLYELNQINTATTKQIQKDQHISIIAENFHVSLIALQQYKFKYFIGDLANILANRQSIKPAKYIVKY
ncbi:hypothetical protein TTHERM_000509137 (macronuclear) [Tetrahymena thermophila SB210]|uniref:Uncharacterized protein n=1 Tax=Tetrahymena thermophila (strain SB210) TaxID=312017 RepID=W7XK26_TETTS|nr:hypothetical protein TTHERM_000509137 [Tetrahymena thermophila SB210]EWS74539.1 hypothetical protein TTHERM_000509137 [Tetrahymena thermophila SB210]|eukprot:XP_012652913.1 hypothetical protein TTHERM_000509137 [Tetrahymena thermophila SB210]